MYKDCFLGMIFVCVYAYKSSVVETLKVNDC